MLGKLFLVVADTTDLITDLRVESLLLGAKTLTTKTKPATDGAALIQPSDGFPSPSQVPPNGTRSPGVLPRRRGFSYVAAVLLSWPGAYALHTDGVRDKLIAGTACYSSRRT